MSSLTPDLLKIGRQQRYQIDNGRARTRIPAPQGKALRNAASASSFFAFSGL